MDASQLEVKGMICPPIDAPSFTVNGVTYTQSDGLSVARLAIFQRQGVEFGMDISIHGFQSALKAVSELWNQRKDFDAMVQVHKLQEASDVIGNNRLRDIELCALFYNSPEENPAAYDYQAMKAKIAAWGAVHGGFFLPTALALLPKSRGPYGRLMDLGTAEEALSPETPPLPNE